MRRYTMEVAGQKFVVDVQEITADRYRVLAEGQELEVRLTGDEDLTATTIRPDMRPDSLSGRPVVEGARPAVPAPAATPSAPPSSAPPRTAPGTADPGALTAPMPGKILSVEVARGARVTRGQVLVILEAMKMKNAIKSPRDGIVMEVAVTREQSVAYGDLLLRLGGE